MDTLNVYLRLQVTKIGETRIKPAFATAVVTSRSVAQVGCSVAVSYTIEG